MRVYSVVTSAAAAAKVARDTRGRRMVWRRMIAWMLLCCLGYGERRGLIDGLSGGGLGGDEICQGPGNLIPDGMGTWG